MRTGVSTLFVYNAVLCFVEEFVPAVFGVVLQKVITANHRNLLFFEPRKNLTTVNGVGKP